MSESNLNTNDSDHRTTERSVPVTRIRIDDLPVAENLTPEQEALILGAGLKSFRPGLETLEGREMPAMIAPGFDLTAGTLTIQAARQIDYYRYGANVWINQDTNQVVAQRSDAGKTGPAVVLDRSQVTKIVYEGGVGTDTFRNNTNIQSEFTGLEQGKDVYTYGINSETPSSTTFRVTTSYTNGRLPDSAAVSEATRGGRSIDGSSTPPPLAWTARSGDLSYAVVTKHVTVPTSRIASGTFIHEVLYNIPGSTNSLNGDIATRVPEGATVGKSFQGADPPNGGEHYYVTTVYALRNTERLNLDGMTPEQQEAAIQRASVAQTSIVGSFRADPHPDWNGA
jgi:phosphatidylethanolamine-binding protein (PEBP) family uncharacterized protein